jgi:hypothetical protein
MSRIVYTPADKYEQATGRRFVFLGRKRQKKLIYIAGTYALTTLQTLSYEGY